MKRNSLTSRSFCVLSAVSGIIGVLMLVISFNINPGPPPDATNDQLLAFGKENYRSILWGAWLQAVGPVFIVFFALSLVYLTGAIKHITGWMTLFGASVLMTVSMIEITFYYFTLFREPATATPIGMALIASSQHLYFIVAAPAFFIPLGFVIARSSVLPKVIGWLGIILGGFFALLGIISLLTLVLDVSITAFGAIQVIWWLSASILLIVRSPRIASSIA